MINYNGVHQSLLIGTQHMVKQLTNSKMRASHSISDLFPIMANYYVKPHLEYWVYRQFFKRVGGVLFI